MLMKMATELSEANLLDVQEELYPIRAKWYFVGLALNVPAHELDAIREKFAAHQVDQQLCEILKYWLRNSLNPKPSWRVVIRALRRHSVGDRQLASELEAKYYPHMRRRPLALAGDGHDAVSVTKARIEQLHAKLEKLVHKTEEMLKQNGVSVSQLRTTVTLLPCSKRHEHRRFFKENKSDIASAASIEELFCCLNMYWDYLNFGILQHIIDRYGDKEMKQMMQAFTDEVEEFRKATTLEVFWEAVGQVEELPSDLKVLIIEHNELSPQSTLEDVENLRKKICREYSLHEFAVMLVDIKEGSVVITFLIPPSVVLLLRGINTEFFEEHHITLVIIDGVLVYYQVPRLPMLPTARLPRLPRLPRSPPSSKSRLPRFPSLSRSSWLGKLYTRITGLMHTKPREDDCFYSSGPLVPDWYYSWLITAIIACFIHGLIGYLQEEYLQGNMLMVCYLLIVALCMMIVKVFTRRMVPVLCMYLLLTVCCLFISFILYLFNITHSLDEIFFILISIIMLIIVFTQRILILTIHVLCIFVCWFFISFMLYLFHWIFIG